MKADWTTWVYRKRESRVRQENPKEPHGTVRELIQNFTEARG